MGIYIYQEEEEEEEKYSYHGKRATQMDFVLFQKSLCKLVTEVKVITGQDGFQL